jgi:hypothetical protein
MCFVQPFGIGSLRTDAAPPGTTRAAAFGTYDGEKRRCAARVLSSPARTCVVKCTLRRKID